MDSSSVRGGNGEIACGQFNQRKNSEDEIPECTLLARARASGESKKRTMSLECECNVQ